MSRFRYTARDAKGRVVKGEITANDTPAFYAALRGQGLYALEYREARERAPRRRHKMTVKELILFCRKLGTMMQSGMTMSAAFDALCGTAETPRLKELCLSVYANIQRGLPLSEALRQEKGSFPPFLMNMAESGEVSGNLDSILLPLSAHYESENKLRQRVRSATAYPAILLFVSVGVVILLFAFVLPRMMRLFEGASIPPVTRLVMSVSDFFVSHWGVIAAVVAAVVCLIAYAGRIPRLNYIFGALALRFPGVGRLNRTVYSSRFARSVSLLYKSGVPMLTALRLSSGILGNPYVDGLFAGLIRDVSKGESLSSSIGRAGVFDRLLAPMIRVGEEAGSLDSVLDGISDYYDTEAKNAIGRMVAVLEPIMLLVLGAIIATVLVAVMLPIYSMYSSIL